MLKGLFIINKDLFHKVFGPEEINEIESMVDIYAPVLSPEEALANIEILNDAEIIFLSWGAPKLDKQFLDSAPNLKAVFYAAGSIKSFTTPEFWDRDIVIVSAYAANAVPVAEYTVSQIFFCMKCGWHITLPFIRNHIYPTLVPLKGSYQSTVGIVSLGMIGKLVCKMLDSSDLRIKVYDPYIKKEDIISDKIDLCSLDDVFKHSDVVSLHTPWLKETEGLITGKHIASMRQYSSLINTSRGAIIRENEMIAVLKERPDIVAVLDVTYPEPPAKDSELFNLPNVVLTPHIAGSLSSEIHRMGRYITDELKRYINSEPLLYSIDKTKAQILA